MAPNKIEQKRYSLAEALNHSRCCVTCNEVKNLTRFYRMYGEGNEGLYQKRCIECTCKYLQKYQSQRRLKNDGDRKKFAEWRGFTSYDAYLEAKEKAVGTKCPICKAKMSNKGYTEASCLQRKDIPKTFPGFVCRKCVSSMRHFLLVPEIKKFMDFYTIPLGNTPSEGKRDYEDWINMGYTECGTDDSVYGESLESEESEE